jgi:hypothetical protein
MHKLLQFFHVAHVAGRVKLVFVIPFMPLSLVLPSLSSEVCHLSRQASKLCSMAIHWTVEICMHTGETVDCCTGSNRTVL